MIKVYTKKKNGQIIESIVEESLRPKVTPEMSAEINQAIKEHKKLVPNRAKRKAVINLAESRTLSFIDAMLIINHAEEKCVQAKVKEKPAFKERKKLTRKIKKSRPSYEDEQRKKEWNDALNHRVPGSYESSKKR